MAKLFMPALLASALAAGGVVLSGPSVQPLPFTATSDAIPVTSDAAKVWLLANQDSGAVCLVTLTRPVSSKTILAEPDFTCDEVLADSLQIEALQHRANGNFALINGSGHSLAEFAPDETGSLISSINGSSPLELVPNS